MPIPSPIVFLVQRVVRWQEFLEVRRPLAIEDLVTERPAPELACLRDASLGVDIQCHADNLPDP